MKKYLAALLIALFYSSQAFAYQLPFDFQNWFFGAGVCTTFVPPTPAPPAYQAMCLESTTGTLYVWNGTTWTTFVANANPTVSTLSLSGSSSGTAILTAPAAAGTPTLTLPTVTGTLVEDVSTAVWRSWHAGSSNAVVSNSAANFIPFDGVAAPQATNEGDVTTIAADAATIKNLKCVLTDATGTVTVAGGTNYVIALDKNLTASALTCTIATAASSCADTTHTVTVAVGDQLDYLVTPSGTPTALVVKCASESVI